MKSVLLFFLLLSALVQENPTAYFEAHMDSIAVKYKLHVSKDAQKGNVKIGSMHEADSILAKAESFAALIPDSMVWNKVYATGRTTIDSFYRNPYKIEYLETHHMMTYGKHIFSRPGDTVKASH